MKGDQRMKSKQKKNKYEDGIGNPNPPPKKKRPAGGVIIIRVCLGWEEPRGET